LCPRPVQTDLAGARSSSSRLASLGYCSSIAALLVFFGCHSLQNAAAEGETRTISFHHIHTNEDLTITYKVNGRYDEAALAKISHLLRDWREEQPIKMDPQLIDLLWEVHRETGSKEPIWVVCGYRSPETNSMLRKHSNGVAKFSQHMLGKAVDFYIPGVPLDQLRAAGLRAQRGGVGFYPTSGSPFVHLDTGSVRHWPRMPEAQLAGVLAKGQLASHSASDKGGTVVAQGEIQKPARSPVALLAKLFGGGKDEEEDAETAARPTPAAKPSRVAAAGMVPTPKIAAAVPLPPAKPAKPEIKPATYQVASADSTIIAQPTLASGAFARPAVAQPAVAYELSSTTSKPVILAQDDTVAQSAKPARAAQGASLVAQAEPKEVSANDVINQRGFWQGVPSAEPAQPRPANAASVSAPRPAPKRTASADPATTATVAPAAAPPSTPSWPLAGRSENEPIPNALAYAAQPTPIAAARAIPASASTATGSARPATATQSAPDMTVAVKRSDEPVSATPPAAKYKGATVNVVRVGDRFNDPWMRAMIVAPSAQRFMRTTLYGVQDYRNLGPFLQKPATTVAATFSDDPTLGVTADKFAGGAVVFTPTVTFHPPRSAALK
jgi:uncharacterized protein YcbK (DUF882 family)